jgi:hypothetical protein
MKINIYNLNQKLDSTIIIDLLTEGSEGFDYVIYSIINQLVICLR